jgi:hypothetical protein
MPESPTIITLTMNPAVDVSLSVKDLRADMKLRCLYSLPGRDAYVDTANALQFPVLHRAGRRGTGNRQQ